MDIDQNLQGQTNPPCTPFDYDYTTIASRGAPTKDLPPGAHTENFYTPLYTKSQTTGHSDHTITRTESAREAQLAGDDAATSFEVQAAAATATAEADAAAIAAVEAEVAMIAEAETLPATPAAAATSEAAVAAIAAGSEAAPAAAAADANAAAAVTAAKAEAMEAATRAA